MVTATAEDALAVRHELARIVCQALGLLYTDGVLSGEDKEIVGRAIEVLYVLQNRGV